MRSPYENLLRLFIKHFSVKLKKGSTFVLVRRFAKLIFMRCSFCLPCVPFRSSVMVQYLNGKIFLSLNVLCHSDIYSRLSSVIDAPPKPPSTHNIQPTPAAITRARHLHKQLINFTRENLSTNIFSCSQFPRLSSVILRSIKRENCR